MTDFYKQTAAEKMSTTDVTFMNKQHLSINLNGVENLKSKNKAIKNVAYLYNLKV